MLKKSKEEQLTGLLSPYDEDLKGSLVGWTKIPERANQAAINTGCFYSILTYTIKK